MKKGFLKKLCLGTIIATLSISLVGCGNKKSEDKLDVIKEKGTVVVGLSADYAPYEFHAMIDGKDEIVGFDVNLAKEIASDLGVKLEIKEMDFDSLIASVKADKIDMVISGMNPDKKRAKQIDFSDIYYESKHGVLVREEDKDKYKEISDLNEKIIGAQLGSVQQGIAEKKVKASKVQLLADVNNLVLELKTNKIDALITDEPVANMAMQNNKGLVLSDIKFADEGGGNAIGIAKNSPKLLKEINKTIKRLKKSGELDKYIIDANNLAAQNS